MARKGKEAEKAAERHLESKGHHLLTRNYHCYRGEIDLITFDGGYVVFVEVKKRGKASYLTPEQALTEQKKERLIKCSQRWIMENDYRGDSRFDFVAVSDEAIRHYEDAFR